MSHCTSCLLVLVLVFATSAELPFEECTGNSTHLDALECSAFQELYDALGGPTWLACNASRFDPCGCDGGEGNVCSKGFGHDGMNLGVCCESEDSPKLRITRIVLHHNNLTGILPQGLGVLQRVQLLDLDGNFILGPVPFEIAAMAELRAVYLGGYTNHLSGSLPDISSLKHLEYFDVDGQTFGHSDFSGASIPQTWADLPLQDLKLKYTNLTGKLPPFNFSAMKGCGWRECCNLTGNAFECPLPPGAELCGATCQKHAAAARASPSVMI